MKIRLVSLLLLVAMILSLSSCFAFVGGETPDYATKNDVATMIAGALTSGGSTGNDYHIEISGGETDRFAASKALLSAVSVWCNFTVTYTSIGFGGIQTYDREERAAGAGVIYRLDKEKGDAYILTNHHVVYNYLAKTKNHISSDITLYLYGKEAKQYAIPATYVGGSINYDLAVLKVTDSAILRSSSAMAATFADSNNVSVLETCIAIGNPEATGISATVGSVNVDSEYITISQQTSNTTAQNISLRVMRIDAAVNSGNSGGGLFNRKGELIGIVNAKDASSSVDNIGYAIPSNIVSYIAENVIDYCDGTEKENVYRMLLGIEVAAYASWVSFDEETGIRCNETVAISSVDAAGYAAGRLQVGDIVKSLTVKTASGEKTYTVNRVFHVIDCLLNARPGATVSFSIIRDGKSETVTFENLPETLLTAY